MATLRSRREMSPRSVRSVRLLTTGKPWYLFEPRRRSAGWNERQRDGEKLQRREEGTHAARRESCPATAARRACGA